MSLSETTSQWPFLTLLQLFPFLMALILWRIRGNLAVVLAISGAAIEMILALVLYFGFDSNLDSFQYSEQARIFGFLNYHAAADGLGILFVLLTAFLSLLAAIFVIVRKLYTTGILAVMAAIQATLVSQFLTVDLLWFVIMSTFEIMLVGYLLYRWATFADARPMITRYFQFMGAGLLLMILGTLLLGWNHADSAGGTWSFDLFSLTRSPVDGTLGTLIFFALFYGLGIRIPLFPLHGWLLKAMYHGNITIAPVFLLGLKVGVYGLLRFVFPLLGEQAKYWHKIAVGFALVGIFYAALLAMRQENIRRLLAYAVISHTGLLTIGLFSMSRAGFEGALMLAINLGLAVSGMLFMAGIILQRTHTTSLKQLGGLFGFLPWPGVAFLIAALAMIGMPGTPGFNAVHFVLEAAIFEFGALVTIAAAVGNVVAAAFLLRAFQRAFLGLPGDLSHWNTEPMQWTEKLMAIAVILAIVGFGFYDTPWLNLVEQSLDEFNHLYIGGHE